MKLFFKSLGLVTVIAVIGLWAGGRRTPKSVPRPVLSPLMARFAAEVDRADDLESIKLATAWIFLSLDVQRRPRQDDSGEETLRVMTAVCGHRDLLLREYAKYRGLKVHRVNFFGVPGQVGHSATEVEIGGRWMFFDALFGLYFARPESPEKPLSIEEARNEYPDILVQSVQGLPWSNQWQSGVSIATNFRKGTLFARKDMNLVWYEAGHRNVGMLRETFFTSEMYRESSGNSFHWPQVFDLEGHPEGRLGQNDGRISDMAPATFPIAPGLSAFYPRVWALGKNFNDVLVEQELQVLTRRDRRVRLRLRFDRAVPVEKRKYLLLDVDHANAEYYRQDDAVYRDLQPEVEWPRDDEVVVVFSARPPLTRLKLSLSRRLQNERGWLMDSLSWSSKPIPSLIRTPTNR